MSLLPILYRNPMRHMLRHFLSATLACTSFLTWSAAHGAEPPQISIEQAKRSFAQFTSPVMIRACILLPMSSGHSRSNHVLLYSCGKLKEADANPEQHVMLAELMSEAAVQPFEDAGISIDNTKEVQADFMGELEPFKDKPDSSDEGMLKVRSVRKPQWYQP